MRRCFAFIIFAFAVLVLATPLHARGRIIITTGSTVTATPQNAD